jgi:vacuolar-type H+-ATPase subunit H
MRPAFCLEEIPSGYRFMKQIVTEVLQAEEAINARLQEVRGEAARILAAAEKEAAGRLAGAQEEARRLVQEAVEEAKKEAERLRSKRLALADREKEQLMTGRADAIDLLVDRICETLMTTEEQEGNR